MSKKDKIVEMLKKDVPVEDICTELEVSTSYVYRLKREMDEFEGDTKETDETKSNSTDGVVIDSTSGVSDNVEGNNKVVEKEEGDGKTNKTDGLGGIKKKKKRRKTEKVEEKVEEKVGGIKAWLKKKWKTSLLILTVLILFTMMFLLPSRKKEDQENTNMSRSRFPQITN